MDNLRSRVENASRVFKLRKKLKYCLRFERNHKGSLTYEKGKENYDDIFPGILKCGMPLSDVDINLNYNRDGFPSVRFGKTIHCKSCCCPVCSSYLMHKRSDQIRQAIYLHKKCGDGEILHLTFTFSHCKDDSLADSLDRFTKAFNSFNDGKSCRSFRRIRDSIFCVGYIRSLEVTYGRNGWHPHFHVLYFVKKSAMQSHFGSDYISAFESSVSKLWLSVLSRHGLSGLDDVALRVQGGINVKNYLTKMPLELSGISNKRGRSGSFTFWNLVDSCRSDLVREYYHAMKGRAIIRFSKGLKSRFFIDSNDDTAYYPDDPIKIATAEKNWFRREILRHSRREFAIVYYILRGDPDGLRNFLNRFSSSDSFVFNESVIPPLGVDKLSSVLHHYLRKRGVTVSDVELYIVTTSFETKYKDRYFADVGSLIKLMSAEFDDFIASRARGEQTEAPD